MNRYRYDVAISFAGEYRDFAEKLAMQLKQCNVSVFYDKFEQTELWGQDATKALPERYVNCACLVVVLFSKEYNAKKYTRLEWEHIQDRIYSEDVFVLPILMDGTMPDNWSRTRLYIKAEDYSIDEIALMIKNKLKSKEIEYLFEQKGPEKKIMSIVSKDGAIEEVEVILAFEFKDNGQEYVVYTENEYDGHGNVTVYVSNVDRDNGEPKLRSVDDEVEWERIKNILRELSTANEDSHQIRPGARFRTVDGIEII